MTLYEYDARMYAYRLKQVDDELKMHQQAWLNHQVTAKKEQGKKQVPVYRSFSDFYNYDRALSKVENKKDSVSKEINRLAEIAIRTNERR